MQKVLQKFDAKPRSPRCDMEKRESPDEGQRLAVSPVAQQARHGTASDVLLFCLSS